VLPKCSGGAGGSGFDDGAHGSSGAGDRQEDNVDQGDAQPADPQGAGGAGGSGFDDGAHGSSGASGRQADSSDSEMLHSTLDTIGLIPGIGEAADLINAGIYAAEGRNTEAVISLLATIPFIGMAATGGKWAGKAIGEVIESGTEAEARQLAKEEAKQLAKEEAKDLAGEGVEKEVKELAEEGAEKEAKETTEEVVDTSKGFTNEELENLHRNLDEGKHSTGPMAELPASKQPGVSEGLKDIKVKADETKDIAYHENLKFKGVKGTPSGRDVEYRYHSANKDAPDGTYSKSNPTVQINTERRTPQPDGTVKKEKVYQLPDGSWKTLGEMTQAEKDAVHYH
jgi:hypothetical protein